MEDHTLPHVHPRQLDRIRMSARSPLPPPGPELDKHTLQVLEMLGAKGVALQSRTSGMKRRGSATPAKDGREIFEEERRTFECGTRRICTFVVHAEIPFHCTILYGYSYI